MNTSQHNFAAEQYGIRAQDYVTSAVHSSGADLDQIEAALRGQTEARVLDLGCGGGHVSYRVAPHVAQVVACDVTPGMLEAVAATAAERGLTNIVTRQAPAERLPFPDAAFDAVLCRFTTHHWQDMEAGLREARRVLKPGQQALFIDTVAPANPVLDSHLQAIELLRDASHVRNYTVAQWVAALSRAGFALEGIITRRLRMEFPSWTARTRTPQAHAEAIRSLLKAAPASVQEHFAAGPDGSFDIEAVTFTLRAA
ncbi:MAG TPA: methyltransferase domain-containing protein [Roseomonas sp.]|nr:methyltransferase domain-containing protein [Roseomonas sp.]